MELAYIFPMIGHKFQLCPAFWWLFIFFIIEWENVASLRTPDWSYVQSPIKKYSIVKRQACSSSKLLTARLDGPQRWALFTAANNNSPSESGEVEALRRQIGDLNRQVTELQKAVRRRPTPRQAALEAAEALQQTNSVGVFGPYFRRGMYAYPEEERLLLGSATAGVLLGSTVFKVMPFWPVRSPVAGAIAGVIFALKYFDRKGSIGQFIRMAGKMVLLMTYNTAVFIRDFKSNWKAWKVYEKAYRQYEVLDSKFNITNTWTDIDQKYKVSTTTTLLGTATEGASKAVWDSMVGMDNFFKTNVWPQSKDPASKLATKVKGNMDNLSKQVDAEYKKSAAELAKSKEELAGLNNNWAAGWSNWKLEMPSWGNSSSSTKPKDKTTSSKEALARTVKADAKLKTPSTGNDPKKEKESMMFFHKGKKGLSRKDDATGEAEGNKHEVVSASAAAKKETIKVSLARKEPQPAVSDKEAEQTTNMNSSQKDNSSNNWWQNIFGGGQGVKTEESKPTGEVEQEHSSSKDPSEG